MGVIGKIVSINIDGLICVEITDLTANIKIFDSYKICGDNLSDNKLEVHQIEGNIAKILLLYGNINELSIGLEIEQDTQTLLINYNNITDLKDQIINAFGFSLNNNSIDLGQIYKSIYQDTVKYDDFSSSVEIIETGIKMIDLLLPIIKGSNVLILIDDKADSCNSLNLNLMLIEKFNKEINYEYMVQSLISKSNKFVNKFYDNYMGIINSDIGTGKLITVMAENYKSIIENNKVLYTSIKISSIVKNEGGNIILFINDAISSFITFRDIANITKSEENIQTQYENLIRQIGSFKSGSITAINFATLPNQFTQNELQEVLRNFDSYIRIDNNGKINIQYLYFNQLFNSKNLGEDHYDTAISVLELLKKNKILLLHDYKSLNRDEKILINRANIINNFLTQAFDKSETKKYKYVTLNETIKGCKMILNGNFDNFDASLFYMIGTIEEALEKVKNYKKI